MSFKVNNPLNRNESPVNNVIAKEILKRIPQGVKWLKSGFKEVFVPLRKWPPKSIKDINPKPFIWSGGAYVFNKGQQSIDEKIERKMVQDNTKVNNKNIRKLDSIMNPHRYNGKDK